MRALHEANRFLRGMVAWVGFRQIGIPVERSERFAGESKYGILKYLKLASDAILKTARHLAVLSNGDSSNEEQWAGTLDSLMAMNTEITVMEKILRALMEANREEESPSLMVPDKKSEPLPS